MDEFMIASCPIATTIAEINGGMNFDQIVLITGGNDPRVIDYVDFQITIKKLAAVRGEWQPSKNLLAETFGDVVFPIQRICRLIKLIEKTIHKKIKYASHAEIMDKKYSGLLNMILPTIKFEELDVAKPDQIYNFVKSLVEYLAKLSCGFIGPICSAEQLGKKLAMITPMKVPTISAATAADEIKSLEALRPLEKYYVDIIESLAPTRHCLEAITQSIANS